MSFLYDTGRNAFARGDIVWKASGGSAIKGMLIDSGSYTASQSGHSNLSDVTSSGRIGSAVALTLLDPIAGVCDAGDISFTGLSSPPTAEALVLYKDTGIEATSTLIAYIDTFTATPAGVDAVDVQWDNGSSKIFKL